MGSFLVFFFKLVLSAACRYEQTSEQTNKQTNYFRLKRLSNSRISIYKLQFTLWKVRKLLLHAKKPERLACYIVTRSKIPQSEERLLQVFQFLGGPLNLTCSITLVEQKNQPHIPLCLNLMPG